MPLDYTLHMIKGILFDFDGTLVNTNPLILRTFRETFANLLPQRQLSDQEILDCIGPTLHQTGLKYLPQDPELFVKEYRRLNLIYHDDMIAEYPGITEMLNSLQNLGLRLAIVSSKKRDIVQRGLDVMGLAPYFELMVASDDVENPKPHPEPIERARGALGLQPDEVMMVGDNSHDIQAAQNAGVASVAVGWAFRGPEYLSQFAPDYLIHDPDELVGIVEAKRNGAAPTR